jgi:hypothetical protein
MKSVLHCLQSMINLCHGGPVFGQIQYNKKPTGVFLAAFFKKTAFSRRFFRCLKTSDLQPTRNEALANDAKMSRFLDTAIFPSSTSCEVLLRNMLVVNWMGAKRALSEPRQNRVTYNKVVIIFLQTVVRLHS